MTAAVATVIPLDLPTQGRFSLVDYTFSDSYATGGEVVTAAQLGVKEIVAVIPTSPTTSGYVAKFTAGGALKVFRPPATVKPTVIRTYGVAGGAAGDHTATGALATDTLLSVLYIATTAGAVTSVSEKKADTGSALGTDKWSNPGGTDTSAGFLWIVTSRAADYGVAQSPVEVANAVSLVGETVRLLVLGAY